MPNETTDSKEFREETDNPYRPVPKSDLSEADATSKDEAAPKVPSERALTRENLAAMLLRFLGLYFTAYGILHFISAAAHLLLQSTQHGLDDAVSHYYFQSLIWPVAELIAGIYFLIGGQWVYDRILTPINRSSPEDSYLDTDEDEFDDWDQPRGNDNAQGTDTDPPRNPPSADEPAR